ncbi:neo-calmodulin-like [Anthonomus grandis grandis]|uniref:neo-calmodulin-like n=1 Tax=Anthonomus grandis grandis TaxID=2921223 RepID=UPI002165F5C9|nr:neo-calmodulin-like [Anthonomus grandis grandis]
MSETSQETTLHPPKVSIKDAAGAPSASTDQPDLTKEESIPAVTENDSKPTIIQSASQPVKRRSKDKLDLRSMKRDSMDSTAQPEEELSAEHLEEIREVFKIFDKDDDGTISTKELGTVMKALGQNPTEAELLDIITEVDKDGNGLIDFEEFTDVMKNIIKECDNEDDIKGAFRVFDKDGKGYITVKDLMETLSSLGEKIPEEQYEDMVRAADLDGDGQVTLGDFMEMMMPPGWERPID